MGKGDEHSVPRNEAGGKSPLSTRPLSRAGMQTLRALFIMALAPLVAIAAAVSAGDCPAVVAATMIQLNVVAAASSKTPADNVNCLVDAYAQPGFCALTQTMVALFTGNACGAASATISAQFTVDVAASFGAEGGLYVLQRAAAPC